MSVNSQHHVDLREQPGYSPSSLLSHQTLRDTSAMLGTTIPVSPNEKSFIDMLQHVSEILNRKESNKAGRYGQKDETKIPLCNVSERIPRAVNPFNVFFL
jgi:hypothetical protein